MDEALASLKAELERFGVAHDAAMPERSRRMLNITRDTGELLAVLVHATLARRVLEIGTSNGYSTLWLAEAVRRIGGSVTTVELADQKIAQATANFLRSGFESHIRLVHDDATHVLRRSESAAFDLIFLDSERSEYSRWWPDLRRTLRPGGLLVVDNAISHAEEMAPFADLVNADPAFVTCIIPVGKGELLATRTVP